MHFQHILSWFRNFFKYCIYFFYRRTRKHPFISTKLLSAIYLCQIKLCIAEKLAEATRKYAGLKSELSEMHDVEDYLGKGKSIKNNLLRKKNVPARKMQEIKLAFSEFYLSLILLQNYQNLNFTGFRKILKKHDKVRK